MSVKSMIILQWRALEEYSVRYALMRQKIQLEDIIHELDMPSIIIADAGLGTINSVVLTVEYMKSHDLPIKGIILTIIIREMSWKMTIYLCVNI